LLNHVIELAFEIKGFFLGASPPYFLVVDAACQQQQKKNIQV